MSQYLEELLERSGWDGIRFSPRRHNLHHIGPQTDEKSLNMLVRIQQQKKNQAALSLAARLLKA